MTHSPLPTSERGEKKKKLLLCCTDRGTSTSPRTSHPSPSWRHKESGGHRPARETRPAVGGEGGVRVPSCGRGGAPRKRATTAPDNTTRTKSAREKSVLDSNGAREVSLSLLAVYRVHCTQLWRWRQC